MFDLTKKVALVTGSSRGIGKAIAIQMAIHGAKVVISSRNIETCEATAAEIRQMVQGEGGEAAAIACNVSHKEALANLVDQTTQRFGPIDILVCNAAANVHFGPSAEITDEAFDKTMHVNVKSYHWLCQMVVPTMAKRKDGAVILIASIAGLRGNLMLGLYGISKAAEIAMVRNLAVEYGPHNIRVNAIAPGVIKTDFSRALWENEAFMKDRLSITPLRRIGTPENIAGAAVFLASEAASFMTGQILVIDGGVTV